MSERVGVKLVVVGPSGGERFFSEAVVTIGRNEDNMLALGNPHVSGLHGRLVRKGDGRYVYEDLGSTNGSMIRTRSGRDLVVDPHQNAVVPVAVGDELVLGDIASPSCVKIAEITHQSDGPVTRSALRRRSIREAGVLSTALVSNPLTSRKVLHGMFELFRTLGRQRERPQVIHHLLDFALDHLIEASVAGLYAVPARADSEGDDAKPPLSGLRCEALRTRTGAAAPSVPSGPQIRALFRGSFERQEAMLVDDPATLARAFGSSRPARRSAIAAPIVSDDQVTSVLFVLSTRTFTQFDLDLLTVLAHHGAASLENVSLIRLLQEAEAKLRTENTYLKEVLDRSQVSIRIIGESPALKRALRQIEAVARTDTSVLLLGETGTGKELFARYLHEAGPRRDQIFAAVNCGALAETLLESELFGHVKGAFTGAHADRKGLFQVADGGTLFLDEVGDVSPALQVKLLRALESGEITPVGAVRPLMVDVRIVAATNKHLEDEVRAGRFREDLFYRINVFPLHLPPLRDRTGDIELLIEHFLDRFNARLVKDIQGVHPVALERLRAYRWPGNVRELQNEIERAVLLSDGDQISPESLSERISGMVELPVQIGPLKETMARLEEQYILRALKEHNANRTQTAKTLGISRQALTVKLNRYGVIGND